MGDGCDRRAQARRERAIAGDAMLEGESEALRRGAGSAHVLGRVDLREIDEPPIVAEILGRELRMAIETEAANHQPVEMPLPSRQIRSFPVAIPI